jgi:hypothetical protein
MALISPSRRRVRPNNRSITGTASPGPGRIPVPFESRLEHFFVQYIHYRYQGAEILSQPFTITYRDADDIEHVYTPDFLVRIAGRRDRVFEVKPYNTLLNAWVDYRARIVAAQKALEPRNVSFRIVTNRFLSEAFIRNFRLLSSSYDGPPIAQERLDAALCAARAVKFRNLRNLEEALPEGPLGGPDHRAQNFLIAKGLIRVDLRKPMRPSSLFTVAPA